MPGSEAKVFAEVPGSASLGCQLGMPSTDMAKTRAKKTNEVAKSVESLGAARSIVLADITRLKVSGATELRRRARAEKIKVITIKKTLLRLALKQAEIGGVDEASLKGGLTLFYGLGDEIAPAKILAEFAKTNENLAIVGGLLEEKWLTATDIKALAQLPSKEQLIAQVIGTIRAPLSGLVGVLSGNLRSLVLALNAIKAAKSA